MDWDSGSLSHSLFHKVKNEKRVAHCREIVYYSHIIKFINAKIVVNYQEKHMKLLRIQAHGLPLFKEGLDIIFYAQQRVYEDDKNNLMSLFSNVYLNPAIGFIGINASGKTSVLNAICLVTDIINSNPINHSSAKSILGNTKQATIDTFFYSNENTVCRLQTVIESEKHVNEGIKYAIKNESLWVKSVESVATRKQLIDFTGLAPVSIRNNTEEFLPDDVSIIIAHNRSAKDNLTVASLLQFTDVNYLPFAGEVSSDIIEFLDPTVERINIENDPQTQKDIVHLKFKGKDEIVLYNFFDLNHYLSSGTIKGILTFTMAWGILAKGGLLIIDEIENHFNKEIVATLMRLFMDAKFNKNGGVLIYSTHYPELLDEYDRNDSIYITRNCGGITAENLNNILKRNDIKKSDAYQSGILEGTTPSYEAYMKLKKSFAESLL